MKKTGMIKKTAVKSKKQWKFSNLIHNIRWINLYPLLFTNLYIAMVATFYVYLAATLFINLSPLAVALAVLIGAANLIMSLIVSYNTLSEKNFEDPPGHDVKKQNRNIKIFLAFAIPAFLLNFVTNFIGPYISLPLIGTALSLPVASPWFIGICIFIGAFAGIVFALYNIVQIYEVCQRIKPSLYVKKNIQENCLDHSKPMREEIRASASPSSQLRPKIIHARAVNAIPLTFMHSKAQRQTRNLVQPKA